MPGYELRFLVLNFRRLTPAGYTLLKQQVVAQAKLLRAEYLRGLWRGIAAWYQARAAVAQLEGLDDASLKDIGLHRSGIEAAVAERAIRREPEIRQAFHQKPHLLLQRTG